MTPEAHPLRCRTCQKCNNNDNHFTMKDRCEGRVISEDVFLWIMEYGCASHSSAKSDAVLDELPNLSSTDLLLIAHDEWKRRQERKHIHGEACWISGWIGGFMTSKEFVRKQLKKLRQQQEREQG